MRFAGYAALFDRRDAGGDIILKGAFANSLTERMGAACEGLPVYWQHRPEQRIGWVESAQEDARGLRVIAHIDNPAGRAGALLKSGEVTGLSFGYRARAYHRTASARVLQAVDIFEISLVTHPMQSAARIHFCEACEPQIRSPAS